MLKKVFTLLPSRASWPCTAHKSITLSSNNKKYLLQTRLYSSSNQSVVDHHQPIEDAEIEEDDFDDLVIDDYEETALFPETPDFILERAKDIKEHAPFLFAGRPIPHPPHGIKGPTMHDLKITDMLFGKIREDPSMDFSLATLQDLEKLDEKKGDDGFPMLEIAFCGRSNAGKSSLVNAVTGFEVSRVSRTPGHTKRLNFFNVAQMLYLVDMPGYGFAEGNMKEIENWTEVMGHYLVTRRTKLQRVFLLVDSRRGLTRLDQLILEFFTMNGVAHQIIFTKCDLVKHEDLCKLMQETYDLVDKDKRFRLCYPFIIPCSSKSTAGIQEVKAAIVSASGLTRTVRLMSERDKLSQKKKDRERMEKELSIIAPDHPIFKSQEEIIREMKARNADIVPPPLHSDKFKKPTSKHSNKPTRPSKKTIVHGLFEEDEEE